MRRILFVFGTRPEAIKLCPVIARFREEAREFETRICATAQHRELLDQVLEVFGLRPDYDLNVMESGQSLFDSTARIMAGLASVVQDRFDLLVVQGDTTTTLCGALAGFYANIPVAHVEAGLRTGDIQSPFPEEMNRVLTSRLTSLHFPATESAAVNLRNEGVSDEVIVVSGNPVIDAVQQTVEGIASGRLTAPQWRWQDPAKRLILVTSHRRESFGRPFEGICRALATLSRRTDVQVVYPVHPNPNIRRTTEQLLRNEPNVILLEPLSYVPFVDLMSRAYLLLTDSGGVQEEGPSLGKPVIVLRDTTERPEAIAAGVARLIGTKEADIVEETTRLLDDAVEYEKMARCVNPYGDGRASERIVAATREWLQVDE
jgi:UDP-N-acetylglucosamine 2-epimerase (non-hydrolysing)